jgi:hypothetical protein
MQLASATKCAGNAGGVSGGAAGTAAVLEVVSSPVFSEELFRQQVGQSMAAHCGSP